MTWKWQQTQTLDDPRPYQCGHCGLHVLSSLGWCLEKPWSYFLALIKICPNCSKPTFFHDNRQIPPAPFGENVDHLPADVEALYAEVRRCMGVGAYTAGAMAARKLLMNVAASQGATDVTNFMKCVDFLANEGFVAPRRKDWIDHIRTKGNEAAHEITPSTSDDLADLLTLLGSLLKDVYEYAARFKKPTSP